MIPWGNFPRWVSLISFCLVRVSEAACRFHLCVQRRYPLFQEATDGVHKASTCIYTRAQCLAQCSLFFPLALEAGEEKVGISKVTIIISVENTSWSRSGTADGHWEGSEWRKDPQHSFQTQGGSHTVLPMRLGSRLLTCCSLDQPTSQRHTDGFCLKGSKQNCKVSTVYHFQLLFSPFRPSPASHGGRLNLGYPFHPWSSVFK